MALPLAVGLPGFGLAAQGSPAQYLAADDAAGGEDGRGPPERSGVPVHGRGGLDGRDGGGGGGRGRGRVAGSQSGDVAGDGAGGDGVEQRGADRAADLLPG